MTPRPPSDAAPRTGVRYTVAPGDSLWAIAKRRYGRGSRWIDIWNANRPMTTGNPLSLVVGEVIFIPSR